MAKKREQMVGTPSPVPCPSQAGQGTAGGAGASRGPEEDPPGSSPASSALTTASLCPKAGEAAPDVWVTGPRAGAKQCVPKKGCSWVLAIKWGPGSQKGIRGNEFLFSAPDLSLPRAQGQRAGPQPGEEREGPQSQGQGRSTGLGPGGLGL